MIKVLNMKDIDWRLIDGKKLVRIDRKSNWGNRYRIGIDGDREMVIKKYKRDIWKLYNTVEVVRKEFDEVFVNNEELEGVVCWCSPQPCHGDVIVKMIEYLRSEKLSSKGD